MSVTLLTAPLTGELRNPVFELLEDQLWWMILSVY